MKVFAFGFTCFFLALCGVAFAVSWEETKRVEEYQIFLESKWIQHHHDNAKEPLSIENARIIDQDVRKAVYSRFQGQEAEVLKNVILACMCEESHFDWEAVDPAGGSYGLMQVGIEEARKVTARTVTKQELFYHISLNIDVGVQVLIEKSSVERYNGAGPGARNHERKVWRTLSRMPWVKLDEAYQWWFLQDFLLSGENR